MYRKNWDDTKLFTKLLSQKTSKTYWNCIHELRSRGTREIFMKSCELIKSDITENKIIGIDVLAQLGIQRRLFQKETLVIFFKLLKNESNPDLISKLLFAIGHNNDKLSKKEMKFLSSFKNDINKTVREGLTFGLLGIDDPIAIETLIELSNDNVATIRNWATFGIGSQIDRDNKTIRQALWCRVDDTNNETRLEAILGLAKRHDESVKERIKLELCKGDFGDLLFESIEELNSEEFLPILKDLYKSSKNEKKINLKWLERLRECIANLKRATNS